jgi:uncharacterized alpha-E superfamily protein
MLSRVAENLFWMGRYLERTEHVARYINVAYFASLDRSHPRQHELTILSITDMIGLPKPDFGNELNEEEILVSAALDDTNPVSILSALYAARENARSVRESISSELWEAINNFYLFVSEYPVDIYKTRGLSDFTNHVIQHCSNVRGRIQQTLLHDVGWLFIQLGIQLESTSQIVRIMISKLNDMNEINKLGLSKSLEEQQWDVLLDCLEAKDMCKKYYSHIPNRENTIEFLLFCPDFPRSVKSLFRSILNCLKKIDRKNTKGNKTIDFRVAKLVSKYQYLEVTEIDDNLPDFLEELLSKIYLISDLIVDEFFK